MLSTPTFCIRSAGNLPKSAPSKQSDSNIREQPQSTASGHPHSLCAAALVSCSVVGWLTLFVLIKRSSRLAFAASICKSWWPRHDLQAEQAHKIRSSNAEQAASPQLTRVSAFHTSSGQRYARQQQAAACYRWLTGKGSPLSLLSIAMLYSLRAAIT